MTHSNFRRFADDLDGLARDIVQACRRGMRTLEAMPGPTLLLWCVVLAIIISILPLALFLFVLFLGLKLIAGAFIVEHRGSLRKRDSDEV